MIKKLLLILFIIGFSISAHAEVKVWIDSNGVKHIQIDSGSMDQLDQIDDLEAYADQALKEKEIMAYNKQARKAIVFNSSNKRALTFSNTETEDGPGRIYPSDPDSIYWDKYKKNQEEENSSADVELQLSDPPIKIDPHTGTVYTSTGDGNYINTKTGAFNVNQGGGQYLDTQTGQIKRIE